MNIEIKPLTPDLTPAYLDFFDNRAFSDCNPNGPCYCNAPIMDQTSLRQMESEFGDDCKGVLRRYAVKQLAEGKIHGYMAFDGDKPIGWCNADNIECYVKNDFNFIPVFARQNARGKTMAVVCFTVTPECRGKGVALALLEHVLADARAKGYAFVEGYAKIQENDPLYDFTGPIHLYERAGFSEAARVGGTAVMRIAL